MTDPMPMTDATPTADNDAVLETLLARWRFPCMSAALELGLFDALHEAPATAGELAERLDLSERAMRAVLPMLAASGLLTVHAGRYGLTPVARGYLRPESPYFYGPKITVQARTSEEHGKLVKALKEKEEYRDQSGLGRPVENWQAGDIPAEKAARIAPYMHAESVAFAVAAAESGVFQGVQRLLDVGGGSSCMSIAVANAQPETRCTVMDLPAMCEEAKKFIAAAGREDRVDTAAVDMFRQPWPEGYDGMVFSNIYHDWRFDTCAEITKSAFDALTPGGRIFIHEMLYDDDRGGPLAAAAFSVQMLVDTQGQQFTFPELKDLLEEAGFTDIGATHTFGYYSVVTGRKP